MSWWQVAAAAAASVWTEAPSISMQSGWNLLSTINQQWKNKGGIKLSNYGFHDSLPWKKMVMCACLSSRLSNRCLSKECEVSSHMVIRWGVETSNTCSSPMLLYAFGLNIIDLVGMGARPAIQLTRCKRNQDDATRQKYSRRKLFRTVWSVYVINESTAMLRWTRYESFMDMKRNQRR